MHKLNHIPIVLIYFTIIYSQQDHLARQQAHATLTTPTELSQSYDKDELHQDTFNDQDKKAFQQKSRDAIKKLLDLKEQPSDKITTTNTKFYVPRAMLERYIEYRDTVREFIPDDREFFGKLDIEDLEDDHDDFWSKAYEKYGSYSIEVEMNPVNSKDAKDKLHIPGDSTHAAYISVERDPEDVAPDIEPLLPPHARSVQSQRTFVSVHLKFNLSQVYASPRAAEDLQRAELHLHRDKIDECLFVRCERKPIRFFKKYNHTERMNNVTTNSSNTNQADTEDVNRLHVVPQNQRLYVLLITGYDEFNEPKARIFQSSRISTRETTPIVINIDQAVKRWIEDPKSNYGLIIRITNDDEVFERQMKLNRKLNESSSRKRQVTSTPTNASNTDILKSIPEIKFLEHVRLKRAFDGASDSDETWLKKRPALLIYSKPFVPERHVKRHTNQNADNVEDMQADDPMTTIGDHQQVDLTSSTSGTRDVQGTQSSRDFVTQTDKPVTGQIHTSTYGSVTKRENIPTVNGSRRNHQLNRATANGRITSQHQSGTNRSKGKSKPSIRQPDKCSKKPLKINFDEVGWSSWIIAPHSYYANYCSGECTWPISDTQNSTNHAIIQAIYHSVGRVVPKSCCAPIKLARMAILYQLDGIVQMRQYDDMIIEACGCL